MRYEIARRYTKIVLAIMSRDKEPCKRFLWRSNDAVTEVGIEHANDYFD